MPGMPTMDNSIKTGAPAVETAAGKQQYPSASEMPEMKAAEVDPSKDIKSNPVVSALQNLQTLVLSLEEQGNPGPKEAFKAFLESLQTGGQGGGEPGAAASVPAAGPVAPGGKANMAFNPFEAPEEDGAAPMARKKNLNTSRTPVLS